MRKLNLSISPGKATALGLAYMLVVVALLGVGTIGATAQDAGNTEVLNETVSVDDDTQSVYAEIDANETTDAAPTVTFYGIDGNETETQTGQQSVTVTANQTELVEHADVDPDAYDSYRIVVEGDDSAIDGATAGIIQKVAGGGMGLLGGSGGAGSAVAALAVIGGAYLYSRRD